MALKTFTTTDGSANQALVTNGSGVLSFAAVGASAGQVIQVVQTFKNNGFTSSSTSFVDITDLSVTITPSSASNKILVLCATSFSAQNGDALLQLLRDSTVIGSSTGFTANSSNYVSGYLENSASPTGIHFLDSPATTSATTYKIQGRCHAGGALFAVNRRGGDTVFGSSSTLTVMEIKG